jgi:hypothetical protein
LESPRPGLKFQLCLLLQLRVGLSDLDAHLGASCVALQPGRGWILALYFLVMDFESCTHQIPQPL